MINKIFKFVEKKLVPPLKQDLKWISKTLKEDLETLTTNKKKSKRNKKK